MQLFSIRHQIKISNLFLLLGLAISINVSAQQLADCSGIPAADVPATLDCLDANYDILDKDLNQTYKQLMSTLPEDQKKSLREEQRKWIKKKSSCKNKDETPRGYAAQRYCEVDETQKRLLILKKIGK
jgi:uncharacterized protein YecT (DUF1311 family)